QRVPPDMINLEDLSEAESSLGHQRLPDAPISTTSASSYWTAPDDATSEEGTLPADDDIVGSFDGSEPSSFAEELDRVVENAVHHMRETLTESKLSEKQTADDALRQAVEKATIIKPED